MQDEHKQAFIQHANNLLNLLGEASEAEAQEAALHQHMRALASAALQERAAIARDYQQFHAEGDPDSQRELDGVNGPLSQAAHALHTALGAPLAFVGLRNADFNVMERQAQQALDALQAEQAAPNV